MNRRLCNRSPCVKIILVKWSSPYSPWKIDIVSGVSNQIHILSWNSDEWSSKAYSCSSVGWVNWACCDINKGWVGRISLFKNNAITFSSAPLYSATKFPISICCVYIADICECSASHSSVEYYSVSSTCLEWSVVSPFHASSYFIIVSPISTWKLLPCQLADYQCLVSDNLWMPCVIEGTPIIKISYLKCLRFRRSTWWA